MADTMIYIPAGSMLFTALAPQEGYFISTAELTLVSLNPYAYAGILPDELAIARKIYRCILTGEENGVDDLEIPISAFSATVREGDPSYLSCTIPHGSVYEDEILIRTDGDIVIYGGYQLASGVEYLEEIVRVNYGEMSIERTGTTDSMKITGTKTRTLGLSKEWILEGATYFSMNETGKRRVRGSLDYQLRCGDILAYGDEAGDYLTVGSISYSVTAVPAFEFMEVAEA